MKRLMVVGFVMGLFSVENSSGQKIISEGTIVYNMTIHAENTSTKKQEDMDGSNTVYLKGHSSRTDLISPLGNESTIHDSKLGNAVILKEFSGQKLMIKLSKENWLAKNKSVKEIKFELMDETKTILGYNCKKAVATMPGGKTFVVYYSPDLLAANKDYNPTFTNLPGLAMEYEIESGNSKFKFIVSKISFDPVQISKFDFPKSGYRVMTFEENLQMKKGMQ